MITGDFKFNLNDAIKRTNWPQYGSAYHVTNEPIEYWLKLCPQIQNPRVLTVAASGDQPLMYATNGAASVDTFDITINACAVMDFKTTALKLRINYNEYYFYTKQLALLDLCTMDAPSDNFINIINHMPLRTRDLMIDLTTRRQSAFSNEKLRSPEFPKSPEMYNKLQQAVRNPFNFIWCDLQNLHKYINGKYDIINISNIFDHYVNIQGKSLLDIVIDTKQLIAHLNIGGYIFCASHWSINLCEMFRDKFSNYETRVYTPKGLPGNIKWEPIIIQKMR